MHSDGQFLWATSPGGSLRPPPPSIKGTTSPMELTQYLRYRGVVRNIDLALHESLLTLILYTSSQAKTDGPKVTYHMIDGRRVRRSPENTAKSLNDILCR